MVRREFLAGTAAAAIGKAAARTVVTYRIKGFTCVACAVGLEAILRKQRGVLRVEASYPHGTAAIEYDPSIVTVTVLKQCITEMGFGVQNA